MEYRFLETSDKELLDGANMQVENGAVLSILTTGYDFEQDETVSLAIVDMSGVELFSANVKPHNRDDWESCEASGDLGPQDVEECLALYEREDEIMAILEDKDFVVVEHLDFLKAMLDRSWIALPRMREVDLCELFRASHSTSHYPDKPATVATLESMAQYYGIAAPGGVALDRARALLDVYKCIVGEFKEKRDEKGQEYWDAWALSQKDVLDADEAARKREALRQRRYTQMNALLWVAGGLIFVSLAIQLVQRGANLGFAVIACAAAVFAFARAVVNWRQK